MATLTERTYVDASGTKVVPEDSSEAAYLLGIEGDEIDDERAQTLGLGKTPKKPVEPEPKKAKG